MPFIKTKNKDFFIQDGRIVLSKEYMKENAWRFKKLTGSRFSGIFGDSKFSGPLKTWCQMVGIYTEPMDELIANVGNTLEPKIRDFVSKLYGIQFQSYIPSECKWDVFKDVHPILGGIPDGEAKDENGNVIHDKNHPILEIKTMSSDKFDYKKVDGVFVLQKDNGMPKVKEGGEGKNKLNHLDAKGKIVIPTEYKYQLALYLYLRKAKYGMFAVCFTKLEDYKDPAACDVNERDIRIAHFELPDNFAGQVEYAIDWYKKYIKGGYSPLLTEDDMKWLSEVKYESK